MKIFNRGNDTKAGAPQTAVAVATPAAAAPAAPAALATAPAAPAAQPAPAPAQGPDISVILDANVKEMSEKIARLASSLESSQQDRSGFEAKIEQMEDRMRKLSSLTEMISAQYNPFVGDAPGERAELPRPDVGLAPAMLSAAPPDLILPPPPEPADAVGATSLPEFGALPAFDAPPEPIVDTHVASPAPYVPATAPATIAPFAAEEGVYLWSCTPGFESSMLLLGWADMLLKSAGSRESLLSLVDHYHNIGWIGDPARDQLLAYANGLLAPQSNDRDWRTDVEVHERSLLFVEKLRAVGRRSG